MLKIIKLSRNIENRLHFRFSSSKRYQFKVDELIYYPKRELSKNDASSPLQILPENPALSKSLALSTTKDYYKILGIPRAASTQEVKSAYYYLAKKYHPDACTTAQETKTFQLISEAYHVLSDENNRSEYDRYGSVMRIRKFHNPIALEDNLNENQQLTSLKMIGESTPMDADKKANVSLEDTQDFSPTKEVELEIKFQQAVQGCREYVDLKALIKCSRCNGIKRKNSETNIEFCKKCGGTGQYRVKADAYMSHKVCEFCDGNKFVKKRSCKSCKDRGFIVQTKRVEVDVPAGCATGDILKITNPLNNQPAKIRLNVAPSSYFHRDGNNITTDKYLTICQAVLGGKFKVRGLYESLEVNIGPGIQSHTTFCFKGKGILSKTAIPGNHIVTFKVRIPKTLTTKQRQLILALSRTEDPNFDGLH